METTKSKQRIIEKIVAALAVLLLAFVMVIKLASGDIYGVSSTVFQIIRIPLYAVSALCAVAGLVVFLVTGLKNEKMQKMSLVYGFLAVACLGMIFVQALSIAGEFENQGKTLQDAMYAVVYLMLAALAYIMCAMESTKQIFRKIISIAGLVLFGAATVIDYGFLMKKAGRISGEMSGIGALSLYLDEIAVLLTILVAVISAFRRGEKEISAMKVEKSKEEEA